MRDKIGEERSQIAVLENDIRHAQADIAALSEAVALGEEDSETARQELENQTARIGEKQAALRKQQENFENKAAELTGLDDERERFSQQMQKLSEQVGQAHRDLSRTQLEEASSRSTMEELQARITNAALARKSKEEELEDTKRQEEDCQGVLEGVIEELDSLKNAVAGYEYKLSSRREKLQAEKSAAEKKAEPAPGLDGPDQAAGRFGKKYGGVFP